MGIKDRARFRELVYEQTGSTRAMKLAFLSYVFIAAISVLNVFSVKIAQLTWNGETVFLFGWKYWPIEFSVGTLIYAVTFPCTDVISELVGAKRARRLVLNGFFQNIMVIILALCAIRLVPAGWWTGQAAYAEVVFPDCYWPDFDARMLREALDDFGKRNRRYGGVGEKDAVL